MKHYFKNLHLLVVSFILIISQSCYSQTQTQPFIRINKFSFYDTNLKYSLLNNYNSFITNLSNSNNSSTRDITGKFFEINDRWFYIRESSENLLINTRKPNPTFYNSEILPQLLNDTLMWAFDGKILNINTDQFESDTIANSYREIKIKPSTQLEYRGQILKTDVQMTYYDDTYPRKFIFNTLKNDVFVHNKDNAFRKSVIDNPNSKYFVFSDNLINSYANEGVGFWNYSFMNRYDVKDTLLVPQFFSDSEGGRGKTPLITYNDSTIYYAVKISKSNKFLNYDYNVKLDSELSNQAFKTESQFFIKLMRSDYDTDESNNAVQTSYFIKKYNKEDISEKKLEEFTNYYKTFKNLMNYDPYLIVEYNFIRKKVVSILDKPILPLKDVTSLYLDKTNSFLIVQHSENLFTIFNLRSKKELITLKGVINNVNFKNEIVLNSQIKVNGYSEIPTNILLTKLDLNELHNLNDNTYVNEIPSNLNLNEFTLKSDFDNKIKSYLLSQNPSFLSKIENNSPKLITPTKSITSYSNKSVRDTLTRLMNNYINTVNSFQRKTDLVYKIKYYSYSMDTKLLEYITEDLNAEQQDLLSNFRADNFEISNQRYVGKNYSIIRFYNVSFENAKNAKDTEYQIVVKNISNFNIQIPTYDNLFVFRNFDIIKKNFYYSNSEDSSQTRKFYNTYVPTLSSESNYYNSWFLRIKGTDYLIFKNKNIE
jgi:hypothetical protein